ncbi:MAG: CoA transferase, partial [Chloroflexota bacterium]|nr:CoA transferase [Chloroflexota bacterium]
KPAFALTGEARSGSLWWGGPEDGVPYNLHGIADQIGGIMLSYGVLAGLIHREKHGAGQKVETSHLGSMMWLGMMRDGIGLLEGRELDRQHRSNMNNPLWNTYRTKDGKWIAFSMSQGERYWPIFCDVVDRKDLESNPKFISSEARQKYKSIVISELDEIFKHKTLDEWEEILRNSDLIWERVQSTLDLPSDQQVVSNDYLIPFEHPVLGYSMWHQLPLTFGETPVTTAKMAPSLGENTEEILIERLGYSWGEIEVLQDEGVIL